jgi:large subunit ribosomal protein L22
MEAIARIKNLRGSARKARLVLDLIRGKGVNEAQKILAFSKKRMSTNIGKLLDSAVANAIDKNEKAEIDNMKVTTAFADDGRILRRYIGKAHGRMTPIRKRTCHITLRISD